MKFLIIDEELVVQQSLAALVVGRVALANVTSFSSIAEALLQPETMRAAGIALINLHFENERAFERIVEIRKAAPYLRVIYVTATVRDFDLHSASLSQPEAFIHRDDSNEVLVAAITQVSDGQRYISPSIEKAIRAARQNSLHFDKVLSLREQQLLPLFGIGHANADIAVKVGLSAATIKVHRRNIMMKLELHSAAEITAFTLRTGFIRASRIPASSEN